MRKSDRCNPNYRQTVNKNKILNFNRKILKIYFIQIIQNNYKKKIYIKILILNFKSSRYEIFIYKFQFNKF